MMVLAALRTELGFVRAPKTCVGLRARKWPQVAAMLHRRPPKAVLVVGFSGALRGELTPGTLVVASNVRTDEEERRPPVHMVDLARQALPQTAVGSICTTDTQASPAQKARLGVDSLAVDLESARLAKGLDELGISWLIVRVVLDALWEELPTRATSVTWAGRALACARRLGDVAHRLDSALSEGVP